MKAGSETGKEPPHPQPPLLLHCSDHLLSDPTSQDQDRLVLLSTAESSVDSPDEDWKSLWDESMEITAKSTADSVLAEMMSAGIDESSPMMLIDESSADTLPLTTPPPSGDGSAVVLLVTEQPRLLGLAGDDGQSSSSILTLCAQSTQRLHHLRYHPIRSGSKQQQTTRSAPIISPSAVDPSLSLDSYFSYERATATTMKDSPLKLPQLHLDDDFICSMSSDSESEYKISEEVRHSTAGLNFDISDPWPIERDDSSKHRKKSLCDKDGFHFIINTDKMPGLIDIHSYDMSSDAESHFGDEEEESDETPLISHSSGADDVTPGDSFNEDDSGEITPLPSPTAPGVLSPTMSDASMIHHRRGTKSGVFPSHSKWSHSSRRSVSGSGSASASAVIGGVPRTGVSSMDAGLAGPSVSDGLLSAAVTSSSIATTAAVTAPSPSLSALHLKLALLMHEPNNSSGSSK